MTTTPRSPASSGLSPPGRARQRRRARGACRASPLRPAHGTVKLHPDGGRDYRSDRDTSAPTPSTTRSSSRGSRAARPTRRIRVKASNRRRRPCADDFSTPEDTLAGRRRPRRARERHRRRRRSADGGSWSRTRSATGFFRLAATDRSTTRPPFNYDSPVNFTYGVSDGLAGATRDGDDRDPGRQRPAVRRRRRLRALRRPAAGYPGCRACSPTTTTRSRAIPCARLLRTPPQHGTVCLRRDGSFVYRQSQARCRPTALPLPGLRQRRGVGQHRLGPDQSIAARIRAWRSSISPSSVSWS